MKQFHSPRGDHAGFLGISLGKTHCCLTELIKKGDLKATRFKNSRNKAAYAKDRLSMYRAAQTGLTQLERNPEKQRKYADFIDIFRIDSGIE